MTKPGDVGYHIRLKPDRERSLRLRHPWVFTGAVAEVEALAGAQPGDVGDIFGSDGTFLGRGTVQPDSQIIARVLSWEERPIDTAFFEERIARAVSNRAALIHPEQTTAARLVNGEGDELAGLVVDRYGSYLAVQTLTAGMHRLREPWLDALESTLRPAGILERGEQARREILHEGGPAQAWLRGRGPGGPVEILEHGLRFLVDLEGGQKTGFYLDQRENRAHVRSLAAGRDTLNLFGYTGAFSVYAGRGGAERVVQIESSATARELTRENWTRNGLPAERLEISGEDVFRYLRQETREFDLLVLDPPPFAKDRSSVERALRAYKDLHLRSFARARPGALIWTFSCSQHISADLFQKVVFGAAVDAGASLQLLGRLGPAPDHPVHLDHPQGEYLKGLWLRLLSRRPRGATMAPGRRAPSPGQSA